MPLDLVTDAQYTLVTFTTLHHLKCPLKFYEVPIRVTYVQYICVNNTYIVIFITLHQSFKTFKTDHVCRISPDEVPRLMPNIRISDDTCNTYISYIYNITSCYIIKHGHHP